MSENNSNSSVGRSVLDALTGGSVRRAEEDFRNRPNVIAGGDITVSAPNPTEAFNKSADQEPSKTDQLAFEAYARINRDKQYFPKIVDAQHPEGVPDMDKFNRIAEVAYKVEAINKANADTTNDKHFALTPEEGKLMHEVSKEGYDRLQGLSEMLKNHPEFPVENLRGLDFDYKNGRGAYNLTKDFEVRHESTPERPIYEISTEPGSKGSYVAVEPAEAVLLDIAPAELAQTEPPKAAASFSQFSPR